MIETPSTPDANKDGILLKNKPMVSASEPDLVNRGRRARQMRVWHRDARTALGLRLGP